MSGNLAQRNPGKIVGGISAAAVIAAIALIKPWEGRRNDAYRDIVNVVTICDGITGRDVKMGQHKSDAECDVLLKGALERHAYPIARCLTRPVPDASMGAFVSLAYNIGGDSFCRSSVARLANAGDLKGACAAISLYNRAGGRVVKGLSNRRAAERKVCERGL